MGRAYRKSARFSQRPKRKYCKHSFFNNKQPDWRFIQLYHFVRICNLYFIQQRQAQKSSVSFSKQDLADLKLPFEGEFGDDCEKIMKLPQYQPLQRIQLILNESAKRINECETELNETREMNEKMSQKINESKEEKRIVNA